MKNKPAVRVRHPYRTIKPNKSAQAIIGHLRTDGYHFRYIHHPHKGETIQINTCDPYDGDFSDDTMDNIATITFPKNGGIKYLDDEECLLFQQSHHLYKLLFEVMWGGWNEIELDDYKCKRLPYPKKD